MSDSMQVKQTRQDGWQSSMDGAMEVRTSFGTSDRGHHYALEMSRLGSDAGSPTWSRPFRTADQAERVAGIRSAVALGDRVPSARQDVLERMAQAGPGLSPAAKAARSLSDAASYRQAAASVGSGSGRESLLGAARQQLAQARATNQEGRMPSQAPQPAPAAVPVSRPTPAPVVVITQAMRDAARGVARATPTDAASAAQRQAQAARPSRARL